MIFSCSDFIKIGIVLRRYLTDGRSSAAERTTRFPIIFCIFSEHLKLSLQRVFFFLIVKKISQEIN